MDRPEGTHAAGDASRRLSTPGAAPEPGQAAFRGRRVAEVPEAGSSPSRSEPRTTQATTGASGSPGSPVSREAGRAGRRFQPYSAGGAGRPGASLLPAGEPSVTPVPQGGTREPELPTRFNWDTVYSGIRVRHATDTDRGDTYAAAASGSALREIDRAVMNAYSAHLVKQRTLRPGSTPRALESLRSVLSHAKYAADRPRAEAVEQSLADIFQLTRAKSTDLERRRDEFRSASPHRVIPVPGQEALERWLWSEAVAAPGTDIERAYFTHLARELSPGRDPWTVSRESMRSLPSADNTGQARRLQDAHRRLVQAMAGSLPLETAAPLPIVAQPFGESRAPASMKQEITGRLNNRHPLSDGQMRAIMSAVARAIDAGELGVSTSRPKAWAKSLVDGAQASIRRSIGHVTASETEQDSSDLERLGELVEKLDGQGFL